MNALIPLLAVISGESLINLLIILIVWGLIFGVLWWGVGKINPPEPWKTVITVVLVLITVLVLVNLLLGLIGHQFIKW